MFELVDFDKITQQTDDMYDDSKFDYLKKILAVESIEADNQVKEEIINLIRLRASSKFNKDPSDWYMLSLAKIFKAHYPEKCDYSLDESEMRKAGHLTYSKIAAVREEMMEALDSGDGSAYSRAKRALQKPFTGSAALSKEDYKNSKVVPMIVSKPKYKIILDHDNPYKKNSKYHKAGDPREQKIFDGYERKTLKEAWQEYYGHEQVSSGTHISREVFYIDVDEPFNKGYHKRVNEICERYGLPQPMISVHNNNSHFDLYWFLDDIFCWKTMYMEPVIHGLFKSAFACSKTVFKMADDGCTGYNCKNPFSNKCTIVQEGSEASIEAMLLCWFDKGSKKVKAQQKEKKTLSIRQVRRGSLSSRHMYIFKRAKSIGYKNMYYNGGILDEEAFTKDLLDLSQSEEIKAMTNKIEDLPKDEVLSIVESSKDWIKEHYSEKKYKAALSIGRSSKYSKNDRDMSQLVRQTRSFLKVVECLSLKIKDDKLSANKISEMTGIGKTSVACYLKPFYDTMSAKDEAYYRKVIAERLEAALTFYHRFNRGKNISEAYDIPIQHKDEYEKLSSDIKQAIETISASEKLSDIFSLTSGDYSANELFEMDQRYRYMKSYTLGYCLSPGISQFVKWLLTPSKNDFKERAISEAFKKQKENIDNYFLQAA